MTDCYAVFGNPVAHSKSPLIHKLFAEQTGEDIVYSRQLVELGQFAAEAKKFFAAGGEGLNVTVPFKLDAYDFADSRSERATLAGAVNTLKKLDDGKIWGDNTDGTGMVRDIAQNLGWTIQGKKVLVLGAGGAVRGILGPLLEQGPASVTIANRTVTRAEELAALYPDACISACSFDQLQARKADLLINGTSASLSGELPPLPSAWLTASSHCYDMMYGVEPTIFLKWAIQQKCTHYADGLGMLVEQAAESFFLWRGVRPETGPVIKEVRRQL